MNKTPAAPPPYYAQPQPYTQPLQATYSPYQNSPYPPAPASSQEYEKFSPRPRFQDWWATVLFILHLLIFLAIAVFAIPQVITALQAGKLSNSSSNGSNKSLASNGKGGGGGGGGDLILDQGLLTSMLWMTLICVSSSFMLCLLFILFMQYFAGILIVSCLVMSVVLYLGMSVFFILRGAVLPGVLTGVCALLYMVVAYTWRSRIPFATIMLTTIAQVTRKYQGTVIVGIGGLLAQLVWCIFFGFTVMGVVLMFANQTTQTCRVLKNGTRVCKTEITGKAYVIYLYCLFAFYWTNQVIKNVVHVTVSGVFGVFYFLSGTPQMPSGSATLGSLYRAMTTSFGSICFGSLIIAMIRFLRALARALSEQDEGALALLGCICTCLLGCIESLMVYFNHYAFTQVAIYGKPFCQAGKDTWRMIQDRGIEAIINDNLLGNVLGFTTLFVGLLNVVIGYVVLNLLEPRILKMPTLMMIALVLCFITGIAFMNVISEVIESGNATTFVALGDDPMALARTQPELFEKIRRTWPEVVVGVNG